MCCLIICYNEIIIRAASTSAGIDGAEQAISPDKSCSIDANRYTYI